MTNTSTSESRTFAILVDDEPGVLARVIGLFAGRGYNINSLTVSEVDTEKSLSRITIVTTGSAQILEQIRAQIVRIVPVHRVEDLTSEAKNIEREIALIKVINEGDDRIESLRLADVFKAEVVDASLEHFVFQIAGRSIEIDRFIALMARLGLSDVSRTGVVAISRGPQAL